MRNSLVPVEPGTGETRNAVLLPLLRGRPVSLSINDRRMRKKGRATEPLLLIAPLSMFGEGGDGGLLLSVPGYGSEVVYPPKVKPLEVYRLGVSMGAAKMLAVNLNQLFQ